MIDTAMAMWQGMWINGITFLILTLIIVSFYLNYSSDKKSLYKKSKEIKKVTSRRQDKINWLRMGVMVSGIFAAVISSYIDSSLMFIGGFMFGIGLNSLMEKE